MSEAFERIRAGLQEALAHAKGEDTGAVVHRVAVPSPPDVRAIRARTGLTQVAFAQRFGFRLSSLRRWEQGRSSPRNPARYYLKVIERDPEAVIRALREV